jgi:hypothetical protein
MHIGESTHPDCASLVDPLFAARKEGKKYFEHMAFKPNINIRDKSRI